MNSDRDEGSEGEEVEECEVFHFFRLCRVSAKDPQHQSGRRTAHGDLSCIGFVLTRKVKGLPPDAITSYESFFKSKRYRYRDRLIRTVNGWIHRVSGEKILREWPIIRLHSREGAAPSLQKGGQTGH